MSSSKYCVYLTVYIGNKMPMFYIGSTSLAKHYSGYVGSVRSKRYKTIWYNELKLRPELFKSRLVSIHNTRQEAYDKEEKIQKLLNVIKNPMYINMAFANAKFTLNQHSPYTKLLFKNRVPWNKGKTGIYSDHTLQKMKRAKQGRPSYPHSEETKEKLRGPNPKKSLPGGLNGMWGKKRPKEIIDKWVAASVANSKGKTYEEIYGNERAKQIKQDRSLKLKTFCANQPEARKEANNANAKSYKFITPANEVIFVTGRLRAFCKDYGLECGAIIDLLKCRRKAYKGWQAYYV